MAGRLLVSILLSGLVGAGFAEAKPSLLLSVGSNSRAIDDEGEGDLNPALGAVTYAGSLGGFFVTVSTGISKPIQGSAQSPHLSLSSIDINGLKTGTLTIKFTDTDFSSPASGTPTFTSSIGGFMTGGTAADVTYRSYLDNSNRPFRTATPVTTGDSYGAGSFSGSESGSPSVDLPGLYSLTEVITVKLPALGVSSFHVDLQATPEPASLVLLGTGLAGLGLWSRRRRARALRSAEPVG